jgi:hypothetical protein
VRWLCRIKPGEHGVQRSETAANQAGNRGSLSRLRQRRNDENLGANK